MRLFRNECLEAKIEADRGRSRRSVAVTSKREPDEGAMVTTKREEEELSEAKREIEQLKRELAKYRDEEEDEEDVAGGKAKSESEARRNVGILFDDNRLNDEERRNFEKLKQMLARLQKKEGNVKKWQDLKGNQRMWELSEQDKSQSTLLCENGPI